MPLGDAVRLTFDTGLGTASLGVFFLYVVEDADRQYVLSVRGPRDDPQLPRDAEALAESFDLLD